MGRHKKSGRKKLPPKQLESNQREQRRTWQKNNTKLINIRFHLEHEKDLLDFLNTKPNKSDYIKQLIENDMKH